MSKDEKIAQALKEVNFDKCLEVATPEMIRQHIEKTTDRQQMRELIKHMHENKFFKDYIVKYQKGLSNALNECYGGVDSSDESMDDIKTKQSPRHSKSPTRD